ncbi:unnamed protein product, partial [Polarella glacialis]
SGIPMALVSLHQLSATRSGSLITPRLRAPQVAAPLQASVLPSSASRASGSHSASGTLLSSAAVVLIAAAHIRTRSAWLGGNSWRLIRPRSTVARRADAWEDGSVARKPDSVPVTNEAEVKKPKDFCRKGVKVEVLAQSNRWRKAKVVRVHPDGCTIHYTGYDAQYDERLPWETDR